MRKERTLTVRVPPGVDEGMHLRLGGEGEASPDDGPPGDLYVVVHVTPHPRFRRDGTTLLCDATLSFSQAALGAKVRVGTLDGEEEVEVPPGTQSGTTFRLQGKGVPAVGGGPRGDLHVSFVVRTPERLSSEQRELLEKLARLDGDATSERGIFDRVKDIFG